MSIGILPGGVIGNTQVFGTCISGSSPGRVVFSINLINLFCRILAAGIKVYNVS